MSGNGFGLSRARIDIDIAPLGLPFLDAYYGWVVEICFSTDSGERREHGVAARIVSRTISTIVRKIL